MRLPLFCGSCCAPLASPLEDEEEEYVLEAVVEEQADGEKRNEGKHIYIMEESGMVAEKEPDVLKLDAVS